MIAPLPPSIALFETAEAARIAAAMSSEDGAAARPENTAIAPGVLGDQAGAATAATASDGLAPPASPPAAGLTFSGLRAPASFDVEPMAWSVPQPDRQANPGASDASSGRPAAVASLERAAFAPSSTAARADIGESDDGIDRRPMSVAMSGMPATQDAGAAADPGATPPGAADIGLFRPAMEKDAPQDLGASGQGRADPEPTYGADAAMSASTAAADRDSGGVSGSRTAAGGPMRASSVASTDDRRDRSAHSSASPGASVALAGLADPPPLAETLIAVAGRDWSGGDGGIVPSFILNAAMIPGWPPSRPFEVPAAIRVASAAIPDTEAILQRFAERGCPSLAAQLGILLTRASRRRRHRMLPALAAVMDTIDSVLTAIEQELLAATARVETDDVTGAGLRRQLTA